MIAFTSTNDTPIIPRLDFLPHYYYFFSKRETFFHTLFTEVPMSYWKEVKDVFMKGVDLAVDGIKEGATTVAEKSKEGIQFAQLKKDLFFEQRNLHSLLADLGDAVSVAYREKKDLNGDEKILELIEKVNSCENKCRKIEDEIESIGRQASTG